MRILKHWLESRRAKQRQWYPSHQDIKTYNHDETNKYHHGYLHYWPW